MEKENGQKVMQGKEKQQQG